MSSGSMRPLQSRSTSYGRHLGDDVAHAVEVGVAQHRVGVHLQRALAHDGPVPLVVEVPLDVVGVDEAADGGHVGLLHRQHDVVVEGLAVPLDEQVVGRQPGTADAEAGLAHDVAQVVEEVALRAPPRRDRPEVLLEGRDHLTALVVLEPPDRRVVGEAPRAVGLDRVRVEEGRPAPPTRGHQRLTDRALGVVEVELEVVGVVVAVDVPVHLVEVGPHEGLGERRDVVVRQRLLPPDQRQRGREPLQVPGVPAEVRLVEVVDVEHQPAPGAEVGPEVLDVQVAVHPDAAAVAVAERLVARGPTDHVVEEQARRAPVERVRVAGHGAVLRPEGRGVGGHEGREGVAEHLDDLLGAARPAGVVAHGPTVPPPT